MNEALPRILVIEDDAQIRRVLATSLESHGYEVLVAASGRAAEELARASPPDLFILDLNLPDADGLGLIPALRRRPAQEILVLSARSAEEERVRALDLGADDFLPKPFSFPELLARVRVALRRARHDSGRHERIDLPAFDLSIDIGRHEVLRGGAQVHLTPIEFRLMAMLVRHGGRILTHEQLLCEVWGEGRGRNVQYLRIYLGGLRRKLERDPAQPRILLTVPGVGYRLAMEDAPVPRGPGDERGPVLRSPEGEAG